MMATTWTPTNNSRRSNPTVFLFLLVIIGIAGFAVLSLSGGAMSATKTVAPPKVIENAHADFVHGPQAEQARNTCRQHGISQVYQQTEDGYYHFLCFSPSLGWFDWIVNKINGQWEEATAFQPKDGTISAITKWIKAKPVKWVTVETLESILR